MNFPITKVFVGDGSNSAAATNSGVTKDTMAVGDLLIVTGLPSSTGIAAHTSITAAQAAALSANDPIVFMNKTSEGIVESPMIRRRDIKSASYKAYTAPVQKVMTVALLDAYVAGTTYMLDLSVKSQHKELWNKNPSFLASFTAKTSGAIGSATAAEAAQAFAKQYTRNLFTSSGSSQQLVNVYRTQTGGTPTALAEAVAVVNGSKTVVAAGAVTIAAGTIINIAGSVYLVETGVTSGTTFYLDTAYQGPSNAAVAVGTTLATQVSTIATPTNWNLVFTGVAQPVKKWDWAAIVDFDIFRKTGFTSTSTVTVTTALVVGSGTFHQVRDLERKNYAHVRYAHNFTEHPAEDYVNNATSGVTYDLVVLEAATSGYGTWIKQQTDENGVTLIFAAPLVAGNQFAVGTANTFADVFAAWVGASASATAPFS